MIVYRELSSLTLDLGFSKRTLYAASNNIEKHYHKIKIPKSDGEFRELLVPDDSLKAIQRSIASTLLARGEISPYATAYRYGGSTLVNARPHRGKSLVLKLDIRHFFDHITYPMVKEKVFTREKYSEANRVLLSVLCVYTHTIPQGAPTSPYISNIIMREFDNQTGEWCKNKGICYTRYCDDMTFSGNFDSREVIKFVSENLKKMGFFLNRKKTVVIHDGQKKTVTGIVVNDKLSVPAVYRRRLRQEIYYCQKYGVASHMREQKIQMNETAYLQQLLGRVNYALSVEKSEEMKRYRIWLREQLRNDNTNEG